MCKHRYTYIYIYMYICICTIYIFVLFNCSCAAYVRIWKVRDEPDGPRHAKRMPKRMDKYVYICVYIHIYTDTHTYMHILSIYTYSEYELGKYYEIYIYVYVCIFMSFIDTYIRICMTWISEYCMCIHMI